MTISESSETCTCSFVIEPVDALRDRAIRQPAFCRTHRDMPETDSTWRQLAPVVSHVCWDGRHPANESCPVERARVMSP